jgi:hypothetical protein
MKGSQPLSLGRPCPFPVDEAASYKIQDKAKTTGEDREGLKIRLFWPTGLNKNKLKEVDKWADQ